MVIIKDFLESKMAQKHTWARGGPTYPHVVSGGQISAYVSFLVKIYNKKLKGLSYVLAD